MRVIFTDYHHEKDGEDSYKKVEHKNIFKDVVEITTYSNLPWSYVLWAENRSGPKAYAFGYHRDEYTTFSFESLGEAARFKEDLRLQDERHARTSKVTQAPSL